MTDILMMTSVSFYLSRKVFHFFQVVIHGCFVIKRYHHLLSQKFSGTGVFGGTLFGLKVWVSELCKAMGKDLELFEFGDFRPIKFQLVSK